MSYELRINDYELYSIILYFVTSSNPISVMKIPEVHVVGVLLTKTCIWSALALPTSLKIFHKLFRISISSQAKLFTHLFSLERPSYKHFRRCEDKIDFAQVLSRVLSHYPHFLA